MRSPCHHGRECYTAVNKSINQSINRSIDQLISPMTFQVYPINQSINPVPFQNHFPLRVLKLFPGFYSFLHVSWSISRVWLDGVSKGERQFIQTRTEFYYKVSGALDMDIFTQPVEKLNAHILYHGNTWSWAGKVCRAGHFSGGLCVWCVKIFFRTFSLASQSIEARQKLPVRGSFRYISLRFLHARQPMGSATLFSHTKGKRRLENDRPCKPSRPTIKCFRGSITEHRVF